METLLLNKENSYESDGREDELSPAEMIARLDDSGLQSEVNSSLNESIGLRKQAEAAEERSRAVEEARRLRDEADIAYQAGDMEAASRLAREASSAFGVYEQVRQGQEARPDFDRVLSEARSAYVALVVKKPLLRGRKEYAAQLVMAEDVYNQAFVGKLGSIMELDPDHDKAPYAKKTGVKLNEAPTNIEDLAGNQLHMLVDQLAREGLYKQELIDNHMEGRGARRVYNAFKKNRGLRIMVGSAIFAGSMVASNKGLLPNNLERSIGDYVETIMPAAAGYFAARETVQSTAEGIEGMHERRDTKKAIRELSASTFKSELALSTVYSGLEYQNGKITGRSAGVTQESAQMAFGNINEEFAQLQKEGVRGGKPYTAEQVMTYVADLYLNRENEIRQIIADEDPRKAFLKLADIVISEDTAAFSERQRQSRSVKALSRALAVGLTLVGGRVVSQWGDVQKITTKPEKWAKVA